MNGIDHILHNTGRKPVQTSSLDKFVREDIHDWLTQDIVKRPDNSNPAIRTNSMEMVLLGRRVCQKVLENMECIKELTTPRTKKLLFLV